MGPIVVIVGMLLMIVIHEGGHFVAAKYFDMKATEAFFGPRPRLGQASATPFYWEESARVFRELDERPRRLGLDRSSGPRAAARSAIWP